jgi:imidazolonepropionase-like amidohydrolase
MTPMQAIKSATSVAAEHMGLDDKVGALREGLQADIIAVRGDPLLDIKRLREVSVVIKDGMLIKVPRL